MELICSFSRILIYNFQYTEDSILFQFFATSRTREGMERKTAIPTISSESTILWTSKQYNHGSVACWLSDHSNLVFEKDP